MTMYGPSGITGSWYDTKQGGIHENNNITYQKCNGLII